MDNISLDRIIQRSKAVASLDTRAYREIARDPRALAEAAVVVVTVAVARGIGGLNDGANGLIGGIVLSLLGWVIAAMVVYFVGTRITGTPTTSGSVESLMRTLGYASAPNVLSIFGFIWIIGSMILGVLWIWTLITTVLAIRAALNMGTTRAIATGLIAWIASGIVQIILAWIFGLPIFFTF